MTIEDSDQPESNIDDSTAVESDAAPASSTSTPTPKAPEGSRGLVNSLVDRTIRFFVPGLRNVVSQAWFEFNGSKEGYEDFMYTDALGLVTTGMGDLIENRKTNEPTAEVFSLPWKHRATGEAATHDEIDAAWHAVKNAFPHVTSIACKSLTDLYLEPKDINSLVLEKLTTNQEALAKVFPHMSTWPADAQLAVHSMAWAMGTGGVESFKSLVSDLNKSPPDFRAASAQSHMQGVGIQARNTANAQLFLNAADVAAKGADPNNLYYPGPVTGGGKGWLVGGALAILAGLGWFLYRRYAA